jgi:hypothetical protein
VERKDGEITEKKEKCRKEIMSGRMVNRIRMTRKWRCRRESMT